MADYFIGIDPGKAGALVCLDKDGKVKWAERMPEDNKEIARRINYTFNMRQPRPVVHVILEKAQAMPKNGAVSMFNYGQGFGIIQGILIALDVPHTLVPPARWAKVMHVGTTAQDPKKRSLEAVRRLCPGIAAPLTPRSKNPHEGLVDAYLIAEWGRRYLLGENHIIAERHRRTEEHEAITSHFPYHG